MVVEALVGALTGVVTWIIGLIPGGAAPDLDSSQFAYRMPAMRWVQALFPVNAFVSAITALLAWWGICVGYRIVVWLLDVTHVIGNGDG